MNRLFARRDPAHTPYTRRSERSSVHKIAVGNGEAVKPVGIIISRTLPPTRSKVEKAHACVHSEFSPKEGRAHGGAIATAVAAACWSSRMRRVHRVDLSDCSNNGGHESPVSSAPERRAQRAYEYDEVAIVDVALGLGEDACALQRAQT